jgi:hypothetical protein
VIQQLRNPWGNYGRKYITQLGKQKGVAVNGGDGVFGSTWPTWWRSSRV